MQYSATVTWTLLVKGLPDNNLRDYSDFLDVTRKGFHKSLSNRSRQSELDNEKSPALKSHALR